jgi:hypothetical protein
MNCTISKSLKTRDIGHAVQRSIFNFKVMCVCVCINAVFIKDQYASQTTKNVSLLSIGMSSRTENLVIHFNSYGYFTTAIFLSSQQVQPFLYLCVACVYFNVSFPI